MVKRLSQHALEERAEWREWRALCGEADLPWSCLGFLTLKKLCIST